MVLLALPPSSAKDEGKGSAGNGEGDGKGEGVKAAAVRVVPLALREPGAAVAALWGVDCEETGSVECGLSDWNTPAMSVSSTFMSRNLSAKMVKDYSKRKD